MHSSLPQRQDHLRARYRALLEDAWGRAESRDPSSLARTRLERAPGRRCTDPDIPRLPPHVSLDQARNFLLPLAKGDPDAPAVFRKSLKVAVKDPTKRPASAMR